MMKHHRAVSYSLPYTFMMLAAAWTRELAKAVLAAEEQRAAAGPILQRHFGFIEQALHSQDQRVTDLVAAGFLEGLSLAEAYYGVLEPYTGPATRREKDVQTHWRYPGQRSSWPADGENELRLARSHLINGWYAASERRMQQVWT
jgi:hypothetical protein